MDQEGQECQGINVVEGQGVVKSMNCKNPSLAGATCCILAPLDAKEGDLGSNGGWHSFLAAKSTVFGPDLEITLVEGGSIFVATCSNSLELVAGNQTMLAVVSRHGNKRGCGLEAVGCS